MPDALETAPGIKVDNFESVVEFAPLISHVSGLAAGL